MRSATTAVARGSTAHATVQYLRHAFGESVLASILGKLDPATRSAVTGTAMTEELPFDSLRALWNAADERVGREHPGWMEDAGAYAIGSVGQQLYGGLLRKASPMEFVTQSVSLFQLYYAPGDVMPVEVAPDRAVLRLVGFPPPGRLFCQRQTGGLRQAAELAGGKKVQVTHVRCEEDGDAYCEWEVRWEGVSGPGGV
jgi:predicted hydrocarbon binding protein